jgi:RimJ/RimL family protein N-acetyltransferase
MMDEMVRVGEAGVAAAVDVGCPWDTAEPDWQSGLPVLSGRRVCLREPRVSDAPALLTMLTTEEVARFVWPLPRTVEGFEQFVVQCRQERESRRAAWFAVVPTGFNEAVGLFQVRELESGFAVADWSFAIGSPFWGTGIFTEAARLVCEFAFEVLGVRRLEARTAVRNGRGNGALRKIGAVQEGVLRKSFFRCGQSIDQILWSIIDEDWRQTRDTLIPRVH